ncbi:MAG: glutaredoxin family protein [Thermoleophilia bacterium]
MYRRPRSRAISTSTPTPPLTITLYSRPGCHLCDEAREALERVRARTGFEIREVDITSDDELHRRYLERIPVVALENEELFDFFVDEAALEARLYRLLG